MFADAGYDYNPHPAIVPRTLLALELGEAARGEGLHGAFHDAAMDAYWRDARDLGDTAVLRDLAAVVGISAAGVARALDDRAYGAAVRESTSWATRAGVDGVPAFVFDMRVLVLGAQAREVLAQAATQAAAAGRAEATQGARGP